MRKSILLILLGTVLTLHAQTLLTDEHRQPIDIKRSLTAHHPQTAPPLRAEGLSSIQRAIGYMAGQDPDSITLKGARVGTAGTYPLAVLITADMLRDYVGCKVIGIRVAAAQSLGKTDVWLSPVSADGVVSTDGITKSQRLYEGWNNVFFNGDTSWEIQDGEALMAGFDYQETQSMIDAQKGGICTVGEAQGNDFLIYADLGGGEGWYSINNLGALCVQLIVDISSLPEKMLSLSYLDTGFRYKHAGEQIEMYTIATNTGRSALSSYRLQCRIDDGEPISFVYEKPLAETANDHQQPVLPLPGDIAIGSHQLTVTLLAEGETTPANEKATRTVNFYIYGEALQRQQNYVEQYNSQYEYMASLVNPILNQSATKNKSMALVNTYTADSPLALESSAYLHDLYAYTVPSFTINRSYFPGEAYIAYDVNYYVEQYPAFVPSIIDDMMAQDMMLPAFATIYLQPSYDAQTRQLTVDVSGQLAEGAASIFKDLSVTLLLTENNVVGDQVVLNAFTGRTSTQHDYAHQHVLRQYITPPLGSPVNINGNQFTARHQTTLDASWDTDQMTLIGFLSRGAEAVSDDNVMEMDITNCTSLTLEGLTGIQTAKHGGNSTGETTCYTLDGRAIGPDTPQRGIYLLKKDGKCRKIVVK